MQPLEKSDLLARLKSIEGHVRGVARMIEEDKHSVEVIKQILAVERALDKVNSLLLAGYLDRYVTTAVQSSDVEERERALKEILELFEVTGKL